MIRHALDLSYTNLRVEKHWLYDIASLAKETAREVLSYGLTNMVRIVRGPVNNALCQRPAGGEVESSNGMPKTDEAPREFEIQDRTHIRHT